MTANQGQMDATDGGSHFNAMDFVIHQRIGRITTTKLVQVKSVTNAGGVAATGTVSVQPLVSQQDGAGNLTPHCIIYNVPYVRIQGGVNAVILDPQVGDIGWMGVCDRDSSNVQANAAALQSGTLSSVPPGSRRRYDMADGVYLGSIYGPAPKQYVQFTSNGISITDLNGNTIVMGPGGIVINGVTIGQNQNVTGVASLSASGSGTFQGEVTAKGTHTVSAHAHQVIGVQSGSSTIQTQTPTG